MDMADEDLEMLNASLINMKTMYSSLRLLNPADSGKHISELEPAIRDQYARKDGKDTLLIDISAEVSLARGVDSENKPGHIALFEKVYGVEGIFITEEQGKIGLSKVEPSTPVVISDPIDQSDSMLEIIAKFGSYYKTMGEALDAARDERGTRAIADAPNSSVTLLKDNDIKYTIVLNLLTGTVYIGYPKGVFHGNIGKINSATDFREKAVFKSNFGEEIGSARSDLAMLCYKEGEKYTKNLLGTSLNSFLVAETKKPCGPLRFSYLLDEADKSRVEDIGVIAHNGEKIQESLPNIAIALYSDGSLQAYKLLCDPAFAEMRAGMFLTPTVANSLYKHKGLIQTNGIDLSHINTHDYPSQFRDTTVVIPSKNKPALMMMAGMVSLGIAYRIV